MTRRTLTRPRHGWNATRAEIMASRLQSAPGYVVAICAAVVLIFSVLGATVTLLAQIGATL